MSIQALNATPPATASAQAQAASSGWKIGLALLVVAAIVPFFLKNFYIFQITMVMVYAIAIIGLNLLTGFNGQFSLGHAAFYAIGAYTAAIMMDKFDISYVWTLPVAGLISFVFGYLFGLPALRLEGIYLALATFGLSVATPQLLKLSPFEHWTGGVQGIVLIKPDAPFDLPLSSDQWLYFFTLAVGAFMTWMALNLVKSRTGRAMMAIRDNPIAARALGVDAAHYKAMTFGVSAMYTGIAGSLGGIIISFVAPDSFTLLLSVSLLVGLVVGGVGWIPGAIFGSLFVSFVPNIAESLSKGLSGAFYGVILLAVIYLAPSGVAGLFKAAFVRLKAKKA